ncbi:MAG: hypothetical protein IJG24_04920 [Selenomonadaceae bacterium]|nr:hypothetical protein [Selenomonadaceae bacterium]
MSPAAGAQALEIEVKKSVQEINAAAISRGDRALNVMRNCALEVLGHDGSGRVYRNGHVASSPGSPPAPDTGSLRRNWSQQKLIGGNGGGVRIILRLRSQMFYAHFLDQGTRKMAPRPFTKPIEQKARPQVAALFSNI